MTRPYAVILVGTSAAIGGVLVVGAVRPGSLATANTMRVEDFGAYWTGTKVNLAGRNAYDPANLLPLQAAIEPGRTEPVAAWSPPWTFAALAPLAPLEFPAARWAWRFVQIGTVLAAVAALWRAYRGPPGRLVWACYAALIWYPTLQTIGLGQHSNLILLGVAGWVAGLAAGRPFAAGALLALVLVKPQNVYLVGLLVAVWAVARRAWRAAAGGLLAAAVLTAAAVIPNPDVFREYLDALTGRPPSYTVPPTLGMLLRMAVGGDRFWLVFLPPVAGVAWAAWYYARHRAGWDWAERMPAVLFASCLTSPYGWVYDQVLFLVPLVAVLAPAADRRPELFRRLLAGVVGLTGLCLALHAAGFREVTFAWLAPACLGLYLLAAAAVRRTGGPTHSFSNSA